MKIIGINGSPRKEGNTAKLIAAFIDGARSGGAAVTSFHLESLSIHPCIACGVCKNNKNTCSINDDMQKLYEEIQDADALMLAFPIYMWQMSAQTKVFIDRLYALLNRDFSNALRGGKRVIIGVTQGNPDADAFKPYLDSTAAMLGFLGYEVAETIIAPGLRDTADIVKQAAALETARSCGHKLAQGE